MSARWTVSAEDSEQAVLGGVLVHPVRFHDVADEVLVEDFYHAAHAGIFEAMLELARSSTPIDPITLAEQMRKLGSLERLRAFDGAEYFYRLMANVVTVENLPYHAQRIARLAARRRARAKLAELYAKAGDESCDNLEFFEQLETGMVEITERRGDSKLVSIEQGMRDKYAELEKRSEDAASGKKPITVRVGLSEFDSITGGLKPGQLVVVAGRTGMGKSALVGGWLDGAAKNGGRSLMFSREMTPAEIFERMIATQGVSATEMASGKIAPSTWVKITEVVGNLIAQGKIRVDEQAKTITDIRRAARRWRATHGAPIEGEPDGIVVVDYLQLYKGSQRRYEKREQEVAEVSMGLKDLAMDLKIPVVALAQLSRQADGKRPELAHLRESGQIEQDADIVAFVYRPEKALANCKPHMRGAAELILAKGRGLSDDGSIVLMAFDGDHVRFRSPTVVERNRWSNS